MKQDFLIDSSGYVLKLLQKMLDTNIEIRGIHNLPSNNPRLFVANHFTRMEALVVPYWLYHTTQKKVGVIADNSIFVSYFGDFLKKLGALSKTHPNRDNIITSDLLQGHKDWLIFPEGMMVKGKRIIKEENEHYSVKVDGIAQRVFTGAAYFGLNSQLLREEYFSQTSDHFEHFKETYHLHNLESITANETMIVPINISYSPLRTGNNFLLEIAKKLFDNLTDRLLEELEIEGNIILNSKIIIQILEPISLKPITQPQSIQRKKSQIGFHRNDIINEYRRDLTNSFMKQIYENSTIRFDHIFVLILYFTTHDLINKDYFKRLIFLIAKQIKHNNLFFDHDIEKNSVQLITGDVFEPFNNVLNVAINDRILTEVEDNYVINKDNLLKGYTHHTIRLKNILKVVLNEILIIDPAVKLVQQAVTSPLTTINQAIAHILKEEEESTFKQDRKNHINDPKLKFEAIGRHYYLTHLSKNSTVVLLVHGFCASPMEMKELAEHLHRQHVDVHAIRLKGHGTCPKDLLNTTWEDWYESLNHAIGIASMSYENIYIIGFSAGGLLALLSGKKRLTSIKGILSINAALELNDTRVKTWVKAVDMWNDITTSLNLDILQKEYIHNDAVFPTINYDQHYIKSILQLRLLMEHTHKSLHTITKPLRIIQSTHDPIVNPSSAQTIYDHVSSEDKQLKYFNDERHIILKGHQTKPLFSYITTFITSNQ